MASICINLRDRFGRRYKMTYRESYWAAYEHKAIRGDPWLQIIPGARGHVYRPVAEAKRRHGLNLPTTCGKVDRHSRETTAVAATAYGLGQASARGGRIR